MRSAKISIASIACPILSIVSFVLYGAIWEVAYATACYALWIITGIAACILPILAKYLRKKSGRSGKVFEIIGLAIASLNIAIVAMIVLYPLTDLSDLIGWAAAIGICVCYAKTSNNIAISSPSSEAPPIAQPIEEPPAEQNQGLPEEAYYMEAANGMMVRVPASRLEAWQAEQDKIRRGEKPELTEAERRMKEAILDTVYGKQQEDAPINAPSEPASNQTDYKIPFIATAISAAVLAFIAIIAVISASYMYSEADMKSAYSRAYNSGYEVGLQSGQEAGFQSGYDAGYNDGFAAPRKLARPMSGTIFSGKEYTGSTLTVRASYSDDYVISVKNSAGRPLTVFYVRAGETVTVNVPDIKLRIYFAKGDDWYGYGEGLMFGEKTVYSRGDDLYDFSKYTWTFTLSPVYNGNFDETFVSEDDFF